METNDSRTEFTDIGHCLNELTVSGKFIKMAQNGSLMTVSNMIEEHARITAELREVERKLLSCNHQPELADYARWCEMRKKDFEAEVKKLTANLETKKCELKAALQRIDEQLAQHDVGSGWIVTCDFVSLTPPAKAVDPGVTHRFIIIDQYLGKSDWEICRLLDSTWREGESSRRILARKLESETRSDYVRCRIPRPRVQRSGAHDDL